MVLGRILEDLYRNEGRRILATLIRLTGDIDAAEDALQEAFARALPAWRRDGLPERPGAWLQTVARRIAIDQLRRPAKDALPDDVPAPPGEEPQEIEDDRLRLLFICCHPALGAEARSALALRLLAGLTTQQIARAFVEPEATTAQRLVRAKRKIREARIPYEVPPAASLPERVDTVLSVLYLIFNEGYTSTDAASLLRPDLIQEAIRLARLTVQLLPGNAEARGLLALMLLTDSRRDTRTTAEGELIPLEEQDRSRWDVAQIEEGTRILDNALALGVPGPYQVQAAIAALHAAGSTPEATDWPQIAALYRTLLVWTANPIVELNAAVAHGLAYGIEEGLARISVLETRGELDRYHLLAAAKADLLRRLNRHSEAAAAYREALRRVTNPTERRYLERRLRAVPEEKLAGSGEESR